MRLNKKDDIIAQQQAQIEQLRSAPVLDMLIRLDTRTGQVSVLLTRDELPLEAVYYALDEVRKFFQTEELKARLAQASPPVEGDTSHAPQNNS